MFKNCPFCNGPLEEKQNVIKTQFFCKNENCIGKKSLNDLVKNCNSEEGENDEE
jgi:hypothetical protein